MLRHTGMCRPNGLLFHQKSLDMVKKSLEEGTISQKLQKNCKINHFWGRKTLRNRSPFAKNWGGGMSNQLFFEGEKSLDMGSGFRPQTAHPCQK